MGFLYSLLIAIFLLMGLTNGQSDLAENFKMNKKYCGGHLSQALSTVCKGNYNTLSSRSTYEPRWNSQSQTFPFQSRSQAASMTHKYRRRRRQVYGVYNECCEKSCSQEELSQYCAQPYEPRRRR